MGNSSQADMREIHFTVASALLSELGERLVAKPHIALAELVKNSYDADANKVIIRFGLDRIEVIDNGHGMDFDEFKDFWMRIGTPHKQEKRVSRNLKRAMTGSKGVGRLAVQFLARKIELRTVSEKDTGTEIRTHLDWDVAVKVGELTEATALYIKTPAAMRFPDGKPHGTLITLSNLKQNWSVDEIVKLAREIWWLQPPFRSNPTLTTDAQQAFDVVVESPDAEIVGKFQMQMEAIRDIWYARLVGKLFEAQNDGTKTCIVRLSVEFAGENPDVLEYPIPNCKLHEAEFEIRIFHFLYRQPYGIKVDDAREYLNEYGGVRVYDAGFHLPFYGQPENDWLGVEIDHSHRLSRSKLLPEELHVPAGMEYLPTQSRLFGVVHVNTSRERNLTTREDVNEEEYLKISVTRDRLNDNQALQNLRYIVRFALDFYAMQEAKRGYDRAMTKQSIEPILEKFENVDRVLQSYKREIPEPIFTVLRYQVQDAIKATESDAEIRARQAGLLGALATAGISALAYEHEVNKQFHLLGDVIKKLNNLRVPDKSTRRTLDELSEQLTSWLQRARATRALFSPLLDEESRGLKARLKARSLVNEVRNQMEILTRGAVIEIDDVDESLRLPEARFTEWSAIFQNVFINAVNAMIDTDRKYIHVSSRIHGRRREILVQDTGSGVDLSTAGDLFKPFVRKLKLSSERRALGLGGSGLGLTIVRMIADNIGCGVAFVKPDEGFNTAFQISWSETS